jgi:hypothetical protein
MLMWHKELWLIDHGAALYFHHSWHNWQESAKRPFVQVKDHVLLPQASELDEVDAEFKSNLTSERIYNIVNLIPDDWLTDESGNGTPAERREVYAQFLLTRIASSAIFVTEAKNARSAI